MPRAKTEKTKTIANSVNTGAVAGGNEAVSVVGAQSLDRALTPAQAYELSSTFRRAVSVIADNEAKATLRFFSRRTGNEIESGDLVDLFARPSRYCSTFRFISDMVRWWKITGEIAILPLFPNGNKQGVRPTGLKLLNPQRLTAYPVNVRSLDYVQYWQYYDGLAIDNKAVVYQIPAEQMVFARNFNPISELRGLSEAITLVNEISSNYYTQRFNVAFFKNGTVGDLILRFPKSTKKSVVEDFVERWQEQHSIYNDNGFRIAAIVGDEMQIESPTQQPRDGQFLNLSTYNDEKIASLLGVPASIMGFYSKTRFDTIDAELEAFAENTLLPDLRIYTEIIQTQIVDRYFPSSAGTSKREAPHLSKMAQLELNRAMDEYKQSDVVCILDPDTLPILARLNKGKVEQAQKLREALDLSANEAADWVGIELEPNPVRDQIWVPNNRQEISGAVEQLTDQVKQLAATVESFKSAAQEKPVTEPKQIDREQLDQLHDFYREFRFTTLEALANGKWIEKSAVLKAAGELNNQRLVVQVHKDYLVLRGIHKTGGEDMLKQAKAYFNAVSKPAALRLLVIGDS